MPRAEGHLYQGLPKYQHVERLGHEDCEGLLDAPVYVQEKIDGANLTVAISAGVLVIASRNNAISINGAPETGFNGAVEYVLNSRIPAFLAEHSDLILRGEWLVRHALNYDKDKMGKFYVFDVQRREWQTDPAGGPIDHYLSYLPPDEYIPMLEPFGILTLPTLASGVLTLENLVSISQQPSNYNTSITREGVVVKRVDFVNKFGRTTWGKIISRDFYEAKALHTHIMNKDPQEIRFAALTVSRSLVLKEMAKIGEREGRDSTIRDMGELIGRVWHSVFTEELWDFVKKNRVQAFNFKQAQHFVTEKTRDIALAYYNGLPEGFNVEKNQGGGNGDVSVQEETSSGSVPVQ